MKKNLVVELNSREQGKRGHSLQSFHVVKRSFVKRWYSSKKKNPYRLITCRHKNIKCSQILVLCWSSLLLRVRLNMVGSTTNFQTLITTLLYQIPRIAMERVLQASSLLFLAFLSLYLCVRRELNVYLCYLMYSSYVTFYVIIKKAFILNLPQFL